jgi:hypothetical protein
VASLPDDENENSNEARNTLFELNLVSKIRHAGFDAAPGMNADIECKVGVLNMFCRVQTALSGTKRNATISS